MQQQNRIVATPQPGASLIDWHPITAIPDSRTDGRAVLLWAGQAITAFWVDEWCDTILGRPICGVTHWADVEGPGE